MRKSVFLLSLFVLPLYMLFHLVDALLKENPPSSGNPALARKAALQLLDGIFHDTRLDGSKTLSQFMESRLSGLLEDMQKPLEEGMKVYKLYNDGFIVKTKSVTVAFDLYRGGAMKESPSLISDETMQAIVAQCDIMFLSHNHPGKLDVKILPGHQSELINNIHVVTTSEGFTFAQTGDQYNEEDLTWLLDVKTKIPALDVLLINCWANRFSDTIEGFDPKLVITGHENELGHTIDHRESYWTSLIKLEDVKKPSCLMTWGEVYWYKR